MNPLSRIVDIVQQAYCALFRESDLCAPAETSASVYNPFFRAESFLQSSRQLQSLLPPPRHQGEMLLRMRPFNNAETLRLLEQLSHATGNSGPKDVRHTR